MNKYLLTIHEGLYPYANILYAEVITTDYPDEVIKMVNVMVKGTYSSCALRSVDDLQDVIQCSNHTKSIQEIINANEDYIKLAYDEQGALLDVLRTVGDLDE